MSRRRALVEVTEIGPPSAKSSRKAPGENIPEVARRSLEESAPVKSVAPRHAAETPAGGAAPTASVPGAHQVHILVARGGRVEEKRSDDLADVARAVEQAESHELWIDIEADDHEKALAPFGGKVSTAQYVVQNHERRSVLAFPYI